MSSRLYQKIIKISLIALLSWFCVGHSFAQISYLNVVATGTGASLSDATIDAVNNAIGQVNGMTLSTSSQTVISEINQNNTANFQQEFNQKIDKITKGMVKSFTVIESGFNAANRAVVTIEAIVPQYQFSEQLKRLRLAVEPFAVAPALANNTQALDFAESLSSSLEAHLTQTRKFAMINRRNMQQVNVELNRISGAEMSFEETVRLGLKVGADYIVLVTLKEFAPQVHQQTQVTGRLTSQLSSPVVIDLRIIDIATGQIKFAHTYLNKGKISQKTLTAQYAKDIATQLGILINNAIYPIVIVSKLGNQVTFNQGGETVMRGDFYDVFQLGQKLFDPVTKEFLGNEQHFIGQVKVLTVNDKTSTANIESGVFPAQFAPGSLMVKISSQIQQAVSNNEPNNNQNTAEPRLLQSPPMPALDNLLRRNDSHLNQGDQGDW